MKRCAIYARKSTEQNGTDPDAKSCARQIENARLFAATRGWSVDDRFVFEDDAISGAEVKKLRGRQRMLDLIHKNGQPPFDTLVIRDASRFSRRDGDESFAELKAITRSGVDVWFYQDGQQFTYGDLGSNIVGFVKGEMAAEFRRQISKWTREAMQRKARAGHVCGGRLFGYDNVRVDGHVERRVNSDEAAVVRKIFRLAASGKGYQRIAAALNREQAPCPRPHQNRAPGWTGSTVRSILFRETYKGVVVWGAAKKRNLSGELHLSQRPETEWIRTAVPSMRIVSDDEWQEAHERLADARANYLRTTGGRLNGHPPCGVESRYLLVGMSACAVCGGGMQVYSRSHGNPGKRTRMYFYGCPRAKVDACTNTLEVPMTVADAMALGIMSDDVLSPDVIDMTLDKLMAKLDAPTGDVEARRTALAASLRRTEKELKNLAAAVTGADDAPLDTLVAAVRERERTKKTLVSELAALDCAPEVIAAAPEIRREALQLLTEWRGLLAKHIAVSRQAVRKLLDRERFVFYPMGSGRDRWYEIGVAPSLGRFFGSLSTLKKALASPTGFEPVFWP
jgi:site-specific DNA recombinase